MRAARCDHLARIQPDPDTQIDAARPQWLRIGAQRLPHGEGGVAGPHRVILQGKRGAEERHDAIAQGLADDSLVAVDGFDHLFQDCIEELMGLLRIAVGQERERVLDVGEEDGDVLALALESRPRGKHALSEMPWSLRRRGHRIDRMRTGRAKPCRPR